MCYLNPKIAFAVSQKSVPRSIQLSVTNTMVSFVLVAEKNPVTTGKLSSVVHHEKICDISLHSLFY